MKYLYLMLAAAGVVLLPACEPERQVSTTTTTETTSLRSPAYTPVATETQTIRSY